MTTKNLKNKRGAERGMTREQTTRTRRKKSQHSSGSDGPKYSSTKGLPLVVKRMLKLQASNAALAEFDDKLCAIEEKRFGTIFPDREVSNICFKEKPFGEVKCDEELYQSDIVSLALFDGDCVEENMLFACSGITLPRGNAVLELTRFVTSACLVREFNAKRNRNDDLRVQVRLPDDTIADGFLGLYDKDIAIVTSIDYLDDDPLDLDLQESPDCPDGDVLAAGRAFSSGSLMAMHGSLSNEYPNAFLSDSQELTEAALGGPLVGNDKRFRGMIIDFCNHDKKCAKFLSPESLRERLELFQILNPKELHFRHYSLPEGVLRVDPSGFMQTIYRIKSLGYPMPPPLVLEFNGELVHQFEDRFGELLAWRGYPFGAPPNDTLEVVWGELKKEVVTNISRSVVSLASFNIDHSRSFACTGLLVKWQGRAKRKRTVVLTSASLVRSRDIEDNIDENLRIEVFLPPNQRCDGTLELYNLQYNIAIVSIKNRFNAIRPADILGKEMKVSPENVVAIGRDTIHGLLMGTIGQVKSSKGDCKLNCKELQCSTCNITKAGIGGPLIGFDGSFVGMNFYDGSDVTPFLPWLVVSDLLKTVVNFGLPSERGRHPMSIPDHITAGEKYGSTPEKISSSPMKSLAHGLGSMGKVVEKREESTANSPRKLGGSEAARRRLAAESGSRRNSDKVVSVLRWSMKTMSWRGSFTR